jgi:hypothetical protein
MTADPSGPSGPVGRPVDVDTGFWLWLVALPLLVTGYLVDVVSSPLPHPPFVWAISGAFVVVVSAVVVTFLILMRQGYRWARTLLTAGGTSSMVYATTGLFAVDRPTAPAMIYAGAAIVGSVLIGGGVYLVHRKEAHRFFVR